MKQRADWQEKTRTPINGSRACGLGTSVDDNKCRRWMVDSVSSHWVQFANLHADSFGHEWKKSRKYNGISWQEFWLHRMSASQRIRTSKVQINGGCHLISQVSNEKVHMRNGCWSRIYTFLTRFLWWYMCISFSVIDFHLFQRVSYVEKPVTSLNGLLKSGQS